MNLFQICCFYRRNKARSILSKQNVKTYYFCSWCHLSNYLACKFWLLLKVSSFSREKKSFFRAKELWFGCHVYDFRLVCDLISLLNWIMVHLNSANQRSDETQHKQTGFRPQLKPMPGKFSTASNSFIGFVVEKKMRLLIRRSIYERQTFGIWYKLLLTSKLMLLAIFIFAAEIDYSSSLAYCAGKWETYKPWYLKRVDFMPSSFHTKTLSEFRDKMRIVDNSDQKWNDFEQRLRAAWHLLDTQQWLLSISCF